MGISNPQLLFDLVYARDYRAIIYRTLCPVRVTVTRWKNWRQISSDANAVCVRHASVIIFSRHKDVYDHESNMDAASGFRLLSC